jgi:hypothetical protein
MAIRQDWAHSSTTRPFAQPAESQLSTILRHALLGSVSPKRPVSTSPTTRGKRARRAGSRRLSERVVTAEWSVIWIPQLAHLPIAVSRVFGAAFPPFQAVSRSWRVDQCMQCGMHKGSGGL